MFIANKSQFWRKVSRANQKAQTIRLVRTQEPLTVWVKSCVDQKCGPVLFEDIPPKIGNRGGGLILMAVTKGDTGRVAKIFSMIRSTTLHTVQFWAFLAFLLN